MSERFKELVETPDKLAIKGGVWGLILSFFYHPALIPSLLLITGGAVSLGATNALWPKKLRTA